jgi:hypothetical protein
VPKTREITEVHTRLLRLTLAVDESRAYWQAADPASPLDKEAHLAFEERWFGAASLVRVRQILNYMRARYTRYPGSVTVLRDWRSMDPLTRRLICHWHLQFDDPIYRAFTGDYLASRRLQPANELTRGLVAQWLEDRFPGRWAGPTLAQYARKLMTSASEAGLISARKDPRKLLWPTVPDDAVLWLLYFLRDAEFAGSLADNAYWASVGLDGSTLSDRVRRLAGINWNRIGNVDEFTWDYPDLVAWSRRAQ